MAADPDSRTQSLSLCGYLFSDLAGLLPGPLRPSVWSSGQQAGVCAAIVTWNDPPHSSAPPCILWFLPPLTDAGCLICFLQGLGMKQPHRLRLSSDP